MEDLPDGARRTASTSRTAARWCPASRRSARVVDGEDCLGATISGSGPAMLLWCRRESPTGSWPRPRPPSPAPTCRGTVRPSPADAGRGARPLDRRRRPAPRARRGVSADLAGTTRGGVLDCSRGRLVGHRQRQPRLVQRRGAPTRAPSAPWPTAVRLAEQGADVVEVGGRVAALLRAHAGRGRDRAGGAGDRAPWSARSDVPVAIDTFKPEVARAAIAAGRVDPQRPDRAARRRDGRGGRRRAGSGSSSPTSSGPQGAPDELPRRGRAGGGRRVGARGPGGGGRGGHPARADRGRPGRRARQVAPPGPRPAAAHRRGGRAGAAGARADLQQEGARRDHRARRPTSACRRRRRAMVWCRARGATIFRVHDVGFLRPALQVADALVTGDPGALARRSEVTRGRCSLDDRGN